MIAEAEDLYQQLTADMEAAAAEMDANKANWPAYRTAQKQFNRLLDARTELVRAADPEGYAAEEERQRNEIGHAYHQ